MLPTRPASGLTCPSFVFVPQAQHARHTPSQQAQAAQQARDATQPIFFFLCPESALLSCSCARRRRTASSSIHTVYDSSLISIAGDRCGCLDANSSSLMLCFCLEAKFYNGHRRVSGASKESSRALSKQSSARRPAPHSDGLASQSKIALPAARPWGSAAPEAPGSTLESSPSHGSERGCPPRRRSRLPDCPSDKLWARAV